MKWFFSLSGTKFWYYCYWYCWGGKTMGGENNWICIFEADCLCMETREGKDNKTIKTADFTITKEIAMEYMKKRHITEEYASITVEGS